MSVVKFDADDGSRIFFVTVIEVTFVGPVDPKIVEHDLRFFLWKPALNLFQKMQKIRFVDGRFEIFPTANKVPRIVFQD